MHSNADALSGIVCSLLETALRNDASASPKTVAADDVAVCYRVVSVPEMSEMQRNDNVLKRVITWKMSERKPEWKDISSESLEVKHYWARYETLTLKDNVLHKKWESDCGKKSYVVNILA